MVLYKGGPVHKGHLWYCTQGDLFIKDSCSIVQRGDLFIKDSCSIVHRGDLFIKDSCDNVPRGPVHKGQLWYCTQGDLFIKDTLGPADLSSVERLSTPQR